MGDVSGVKLRSFRAGIGRDDEDLAQDDPHRLFDMLGEHDAQREYRRDAVEATVHRLMAYDLRADLPPRRARHTQQQTPEIRRSSCRARVCLYVWTQVDSGT